MEQQTTGDGPLAKRAEVGALATSKNLTEEVVREKVLEVALSIIGDDADCEFDMPLMQAGLTSNTAVLLRDDLASAIPGIHLPPTLIFDYPSVGAIADYI